MEYRKLGDTIVLCLVRGEDVLASIRAVCNAERVRLAEISALGAADYAEVGVYHLAEKRFLPRTLEGEMEICALTGSVTRRGTELYLHLHGSLPMPMAMYTAGMSMKSESAQQPRSSSACSREKLTAAWRRKAAFS